MRTLSFGRAVLTGALVMLAALAAVFAARHLIDREALPVQPADFNPARFVQSGPPLDAPYVVTDYDVVDAMLAMADIRPDESVIDLGSGDGRILIAAARSHGARGLGVDIDPARIREANANAQAAGVASRVAFRREDLFRTPLADADVLTLYLAPEINARLRPRILGEMRPGTRVVSHDFDMGDWRADQREMVGTASIYMWVVPARIAGRWRISANGRTVEARFDQRYQDFTGTFGEDGRIDQGRIDGANLHFTADLGGGRRTYAGRVEGDRIVPADPAAPWQATRLP